MEETKSEMTDIELKSVQSLDNLSLKNWTLPEKKKEEKVVVEEKKEEEKAETDDGMASLIPEYIREICKNPKSAELRVSYDAPTVQSTYTYSITWESDEIEAVAKGRVLKSVPNPTKFGKLPLLDGHVKVVSAPSLTPVTALCDGPCKKEFSSNLLSTVGRCGHYLCSACYGIVKNDDGSNGCSALRCFWQGASREESKRNYEKNVCRKQRKKAMDMSSRGIDVKPASVASSISELSSAPTPMPKRTNSETDLSSYGNLTQIPSYRKPVKSSKSIKVRLILVEAAENYSIAHTYMEHRIKPETKLIRTLQYLLKKKNKSPESYIPSARLYYGMLTEEDKLGMRRIKKSCYDEVTVDEVPRLGDRLVLIMDMNDFVSKGIRIVLE
uniref:RING-type domain-containing protein n=1 Tax=Caenorhabditis tropicalis TaxID=1561998 RepID=A0A1I7T5C5_9PELO